MKLPHLANAVVPEEKVVNYLLSPTHRDGRHKAVFFARFGFVQENWEELQQALLKHVADHDVARVEESPFGTRYVIEGRLQGRDGRLPRVRSVWFLGGESEIPRLATAYPLPEADDD